MCPAIAGAGVHHPPGLALGVPPAKKSPDHAHALNYGVVTLEVIFGASPAPCAAKGCPSEGHTLGISHLPLAANCDTCTANPPAPSALNSSRPSVFAPIAICDNPR